MDLSVTPAHHNKDNVRFVAKRAVQYQCSTVFTLPGHTPFLRLLIADESNFAIGGVVGFLSGDPMMKTKIAKAEDLVEL